MDQAISLARLFTFLFPLIFLIANLGQAAILYVGGKQIITGLLTLGAWQEFSLYLMYLFFPIAQFGFIITQYGQAAASADRIFEILDAKSDIVDQAGCHRAAVREGRCALRERHLPLLRRRRAGASRMSPSKPRLGSALPCSARPAPARAPSSTCCRASMTRARAASRSTVTTCAMSSSIRLRRQIGIVLQETTLFSGTIRENIAFGRPDASDDDVMAAARAAQAHDFIMSFPEGYDTHVGERGTTLSGGQKQRIAIARALLLDPRILILDDSTSSVDLTTEALIQAALDNLMKGRTSFVIAQRISTVMTADKILVLDKGEVVAQGKHADLMENEPIYAEIYNSQILAYEQAPCRRGELTYDGRPGRFGDILNQETLKPRSLSSTLRRLGAYFGRFWPGLIAGAAPGRHRHLDAGDHPRPDGTGHRLLPGPAWAPAGAVGAAGNLARQPEPATRLPLAGSCDDPATQPGARWLLSSAYRLGGFVPPALGTLDDRRTASRAWAV